MPDPQRAADRRKALDDLAIIDTGPEAAFDQLAGLAAAQFDVPLTFIALLDGERQWFKARVGIALSEVPCSISLCTHVVEEESLLVVPDIAADPRFAANPFVTGEPYIRFYAGAPLRHDGVTIGTLCLIDVKPRTDFGDRERRLLGQMADTVSATLAMRTSSKRLEESLRRANETAEAHQQAKSDFLSNMSHEIRTPLTTMIGYANLLTGVKDLPRDAQHYIGRINKAGKALLALVNDVLDFSKLEAGQVTLDPQPAQIRALATDVVEEFQGLAQSKGFEILLDCDDDAARWLLVDDVRIRQVLYNLVGNACKFTRHGFVKVKVRIADGRLRVSVRDSGPGLTPEQQGQLFKRFTQVDSGITRKYGGSGLGLSICYEIVQLMRGQIGVSSEPGRGSVFWFDIPVIEAEAPVAVPQPDLRPVFLEDRRVLICDDHPINRELIRLLLKDYGLEIYEACDGSEGVNMCMRMHFDLVFMDIQMPVLDGIVATRTIREQCPLNARTPIVALSARNQTQLSEDVRGQGFSFALTKPIDMPQFYATLHRCLEGDDQAERYASVG